MTYEPMDTEPMHDPLLALMQTRGEYTPGDEDELTSIYLSALHRAKTAEAERMTEE